jgi:hypothetical protein
LMMFVLVQTAAGAGAAGYSAKPALPYGKYISAR